MKIDGMLTMKSLYPISFIIIFLGISFLPILKMDVSISTLETDFLDKNMLIEGFNNLRLYLGDRVFTNVIVGKLGWLFYTANNSMDEYQGTNPYTYHELRDMINNWDALNDQLKKKGILFVVVIGPDKNSIYPQYMPDEIKKLGGRTRFDQFVNYMKKYGKTPVIDLRPDLIAASKTKQVYYKTDTHWNASAQYIAYAKILSVLSQRYPELVAHPSSDFEPINKGLITFGLPYIMGTPNIKEDYWYLQPKFEPVSNFNTITLPDGRIVRISTNQDGSLPIALIYHDSFLDQVVPLLEPHFRQLTSLPSSPYPEIWSLKWVDQTHPDIVIFESVERYFNEQIYLPSNQ